jgi:micrococcal nuclease
MLEFLYHYKVKVVKVVDGDTIYGDVDLGFNITQKKMEFRFAGINTPELRGENREAGLLAKEYVAQRILDKEIMVLTKKDTKEKFGRYLAWVYYNVDGEWVCLNEELIEQGLAIPFMS